MWSKIALTRGGNHRDYKKRRADRGLKSKKIEYPVSVTCYGTAVEKDSSWFRRPERKTV